MDSAPATSTCSFSAAFIPNVTSDECGSCPRDEDKVHEEMLHVEDMLPPVKPPPPPVKPPPLPSALSSPLSSNGGTLLLSPTNSERSTASNVDPGAASAVKTSVRHNLLEEKGPASWYWAALAKPPQFVRKSRTEQQKGCARLAEPRSRAAGGSASSSAVPTTAAAGRGSAAAGPPPAAAGLLGRAHKTDARGKDAIPRPPPRRADEQRSAMRRLSVSNQPSEKRQNQPSEKEQPRSDLVRDSPKARVASTSTLRGSGSGSSGYVSTLYLYRAGGFVGRRTSFKTRSASPQKAGSSPSGDFMIRRRTSPASPRKAGSSPPGDFMIRRRTSPASPQKAVPELNEKNAARWLRSLHARRAKRAAGSALSTPAERSLRLLDTLVERVAPLPPVSAVEWRLRVFDAWRLRGVAYPTRILARTLLDELSDKIDGIWNISEKAGFKGAVRIAPYQLFPLAVISDEEMRGLDGLDPTDFGAVAAGESAEREQPQYGGTRGG